MKKILVLFIIIISLYAEEYLIDETVNMSYVNTLDMLVKAETYIYLDSRNFNLYIQESIYKNCLSMNRENRDVLQKAIEKYKEWNKIAIQNKKLVNKEITRDKIQLHWAYQTSKNWNHCFIEVAYYMFSQTETEHQFLIVLGLTENRTDIPVFYMNHDEVEELESMLKEDFIIQKIYEGEKKKEAEGELFK